jgi:uncharacterized protein YkvS
MIKFFRRIRQQLLAENKTGKYLKYAIGEIVLVMIGIILALQVNNWNEERKNHINLTSNLYGVLEELKNDTTLIRAHIDNFIEANKNRKTFINHTNYNEFTRDSLEQSLENFTYALSLDYSYYHKIRNSDITEYGIYNDVMESIIRYYDIGLPFIKDQSAWYSAQVAREDEYWRYEQKTYEFKYVDGLNSYQNEEAAKKELITLLNSITARNILKIDVRRNGIIIDHLTSFQSFLKTTISDLEKVLQ